MVSMNNTRGFTLIELMIAGVIASFLIAVLFSILTMASRTAQTQEDLTRTVDRVHYAVEAIRADLARTGYGMGLVPLSTLELTSDEAWRLEDCNNIAGIRRPIIWEDGGSNANPSGDGMPLKNINAQDDPDNTAIGEQPDRLTLIGAFRIPKFFGGGDADAVNPPDMFMYQENTARIRVNPNAMPWMGFQPQNSVQIANAFNDSLLAIHNSAGGVRYQTIINSDYSGNDVLLSLSSPGMPRNNGERCLFQSNMESFSAIALQRITYELVDDPFNENGTILTRTLMSPDGTRALSRIPIARNIVDFQIWFDEVNAEGVPVTRDGLAIGSSEIDDQGTFSGDRTELARLAHIQITARLDNESDRLTHLSLPIDSLQTSIDIDDDPSNSARLITVRAEAALHSLASAGHR